MWRWIDEATVVIPLDHREAIACEECFTTWQENEAEDDNVAGRARGLLMC